LTDTTKTSDGLGRRSFSVVRTLGEGAFGSVFLADMVSAGGFRRRVALKLLNSTYDPESDAGRRLRDEARLLGRLQHRNIVRVDDLLQLRGRWGLLMEYIPGLDVETLFDRARSTGVDLPVRAMLQVCAATAAALDAAFSAVGDDGQALLVVHRDIKPSNVRLSETGEVKVLDFGVARAEFTGREAKTERVRYGSLGYMAPERILGEPETAAGDVYSLGAMLFELLTLESYGRAELAPEKQAEQVRVAVEKVRARVGDEIADVVRQCLSYDGADRPTARELEGVLRRAAAKVPGDDVQDFAVASFGGLGSPSAPGPDPAEGMLLEEGTTAVPLLRAMGAVPSGQSQSPTLAVSDLEPLPEPFDEPVARRSPVGLVAVAVGLVAVLLVAGFAWRASVAPSATPAPAEPAPVAAAPAVAPPPAAAPVEALTVVSAPAAVDAPSAARPAPPAAGKPAAAAAPAVAQPAAAAAPVAAASARLRAAKFVLAGGEGISVTCGDVTATGTTNALVRDFPAGACTVVVAGKRATISLDAPGQVNCTLEGEALSCR